MFSKYKPIEWLAGAALMCAAVFFWYKNYFIQDDAYIAFVYAKNFAHGHGLVWYPGLDEYGYTNFLYTLIVGTVMFWLPGIDPEYISATFNFTAYLAALLLTYLITLKLSSSKIAATCAVLILATHHTFSAYASGGLETMVVTALIMAFYHTLFTNHQPPTTNHLILAILAAAALLTRLDSALLLFPGYVYLLTRHCEEYLATKQSTPSTNWIASRFAALALAVTNKNLWVSAGIPTLCVLALLGWAKLYYGYALPNTFYAKIPGDTSMVWLGQRYILKYLDLHHYIPAILLALATIIIFCHSERMRGILKIPRQARDDTAESPIPNPQSPLITLLMTIALWLAYVVYVGGCFMEFRLLVPILPIFAVVVFAAIGQLDKKKLLLALLIVTLTGSVLLNQRHRAIAKHNMGVIASTSFLNHYLVRKDANWREIGLGLKGLFPQAENLVIAIFPAGTIPYYSGIQSFDVYGLNYRQLFLDSAHQRRGSRLNIPGHLVVANDLALSENHVNLNMYHPHPLCKNRDGRYTPIDRNWRVFPYTRNRTILLPINERCYLAADYRITHPLIETGIANGTILDYRTNQDKFKCPEWLCLR